MLTDEGEVDKECIDLIAKGPPSLLESGNLTPGHPYFGPVCDLTALRAALAAAAAQAFRGVNDIYPTSLDLLVPEYLPSTPRDPYADAPLRSVAHDPVSRAHPGSSRPATGAGVLTIYSVGYDQDDDGGVDVGNRIEEDGDIALTLGVE